MKLARYRDADDEHWGAVDVTEGVLRPLLGSFDEWAPAITRHGPEAARLARSTVPLSSVQLLAPVAPTTRVYGTGINYRSHGETAGQPARADAAPCFMVSLSAIIGPDDVMRYPDITDQFDYEIELVCMIGAPLSDAESAIQAILGYTIGCDSSARDAGVPMGLPIDFFTMKGIDGTKPLGPWIVTRDELGGDTHPALTMTTRVNGELRQHDTTESMTWDVGRCAAWLNVRNVLTVGDIVFTGTCGGTAVEDELRTPGTGRFLVPGDLLELEIEGIGLLHSTVGAKSPHHVGYPTSIAQVWSPTPPRTS